jgi:hypothetical protein
MDLSKLTNEELLKIVKQKTPKFAGEVSKKTYSDSIGESKVQDLNPAPILIPKPSNYATDFNLNQLVIKEIDYSIAKTYISENHYSHTLGCSIQLSLGFYYNNELVTAIIYGDPIGINVKSFLQTEGKSLELVRLFSKDGLPKNTESYVLSKSFKWLKEKYKDYKYLISYADANHGHCGYIYQATNWKYIGLSAKDGHPTIYIDGKNVHPRSLYSKHGTSGISVLKEIYGNRLETKEKLQKHVYLMCLGNHRECKDWYSKFTFLPYPKAHNDIIKDN